MSRQRVPIAASCFVLASAFAIAQNCAVTSVGFVPLNDLGTGIYMGQTGGLYPGGANARPAAHEAAGLAQAALVQPLDGLGNPSPTGRIVLLTVGMSNTSQESDAFIPVSAADPLRNPSLTVVNGAQGGQHAAIIADPTANFWNVIDARLAAQGVTPAQVQVVWLKEAIATPTGGFLTHAQLLQGYLEQIVQIIKSRYPACRLCYLSCRIYAGYATSMLNPEPYAYENGFSAKWLIESQIAGAPTLNFDPATGPVLAPWLAWGPYFWADGLTPRSDGLTWLCSDYSPDGTHPGPAGRTKVANLLQGFFATDATTVGWYHGAGTGLLPAATNPYGVGCAGSNGVPQIVTNGLPVLGTPGFAIGVTQARPLSPATLLVSLAPAALVFGACTLNVDPLQLVLPTPTLPTTVMTSPTGQVPLFIPIPSDPALDQLSVFAEWIVLDPLGQAFPEFGGIAWTRGLELRLSSIP